jgi:hypothetical protein
MHAESSPVSPTNVGPQDIGSDSDNDAQNTPVSSLHPRMANPIYVD